MLCWEDEHLPLAVVAAVFVIFYTLLMPAAEAYALFVIGGNGVRLNSTGYKARFGFLHLRYICMHYQSYANVLLMYICTESWSPSQRTFGQTDQQTDRMINSSNPPATIRKQVDRCVGGFDHGLVDRRTGGEVDIWRVDLLC